ncbi:competence/damage-inducible protein A [Halomicrobium salinisoli]|uniref:competence/damage-inducible protein A n=1 Tax=Halomicrobium salinisoli TaxID=2878391 RepID=UPI001CF040EE|nr:competence/damage-inducible protein A [Halomicrobium salinisoli]
MDVALLTVGDELLSGDTENTNATWLARELTGRGASVRRVLTVPDDREVIAEYVREWRERFDAVIVTGGLGDTPDDVTVEAVADAFDRGLEVPEDVRERVEQKAREYREANPERFEEYEFDIDFDETAALPAGARPLQTAESFNPGCVVENVYVFPGFPEELKAMFGAVAEEFGGDVVTESVATVTPEGALKDVLDGVRERFDVAVGSYPVREDRPGRVKVSGTDGEEVTDAAEWVRQRVRTPEE